MRDELKNLSIHTIDKTEDIKIIDYTGLLSTRNTIKVYPNIFAIFAVGWAALETPTMKSVLDNLVIIKVLANSYITKGINVIA